MIVDVYEVSNIILNKNHYGWLAPTRFGLLAKNAQLRIYDELFDDYRRAKNRVLKNSAEISIGKIKQALSTIYKSASLTYSSGTFALPSDVNTIEGVYVNDEIATEITESKYKMLSRSIVPASEDDPMYVGYGSTIKIYPPTVGVLGGVSTPDVTISYYGTPPDPYISFIEVGDNRILDPSSVVDFTLPDIYFDKIVVYILQQLGVSIREQEVQQYSQNEEVKKMQKNNV